MFPKAVTTASRVLREGGPLALAAASLESFQVWWRHGELFEAAKYAGKPSEIARLQGCRFSLDSPALTDDVRYLLLSGQHEKPERRMIARFLDSTRPVVELGGFIGVVACTTNRRLRNPSRHVVVEANPAVLELLTGNRARNRSQFAIVHAALAYGAPNIEFHVNDNPLTSCVNHERTDTVLVPTVTLEHLLEAASFEQCTLICDIEGAEADLIEHELSVLKDRVPMMIVEVHDRILGAARTRQLFDALREAGFVELERQWDTVALRNRSLAF